MKDVRYTGQKSYHLEIAGAHRNLPVIEVSPGHWIASFVLLGDTELVERCGQALAGRLEEWDLDCLVVPEGRGLALAHVVAAHLSRPNHYLRYIVARKGIKPYMREPLVQTTNTITTAGEQMLVLDGNDASKLANKRVCVLDDLISTGGTTRAVATLARAAGAEVCCVAAVLIEGAAVASDPLSITAGIPIVWLGKLPVFRT